jgi:hypothetical protein
MLILQIVVVDVGVFSLCPHAKLIDLFGEYSSYLVGVVHADQIEGDSTGLVLVGLTCQTHMLVVPPRRGVMASCKGMIVCPIFDVEHTVWACMYEGMRIEVGMSWLDIGVEATMLMFVVLIGLIYSALFGFGGIVLSAFRDRVSLSRRVNVAACPSPDGSSARASAKGGERGGRRPA